MLGVLGSPRDRANYRPAFSLFLDVYRENPRGFSKNSIFTQNENRSKHEKAHHIEELVGKTHGHLRLYMAAARFPRTRTTFFSVVVLEVQFAVVVIVIGRYFEGIGGLCCVPWDQGRRSGR